MQPPIVSGTLDASYLREALARAGVSLEPTEIVTETLSGGRTAAKVIRVRTGDGDARSFVVKVVPQVAWREALAMDGAEGRLWLAGATRALPAGLRCPTLDVGRDPTRGEWWILMDDVSDGILPRGGYDASKAATFLRALARLHARFWERDAERDAEVDALPVATWDKSANALASLSAHIARGGDAPPPEPWLAELDKDFWVPRALLPALLDVLGPRDADSFVDLCRDHARIAALLAKHPRTVCHGDLRRANISFVDSDVVLFDWEFASTGPAARDLAWWGFLQFWAYPPGEGAPADREAWVPGYLEALEQELGRKVDRERFAESLELGFLSILCQIGFCLGDSPNKQTIADAIARARRIHDRYVR